MTEARLKEITKAMQNSPLSWAMYYCESDACACLGCVNTAIRIGAGKCFHPELTPPTIDLITKEEWQEWWRIQGQCLGNPD